MRNFDRPSCRIAGLLLAALGIPGVVVPRLAMAQNYYDPKICTGANTLFDELDRYYCEGYLLKSDCSRLLNPTAMVPSSDDENEWRAACEQGRERRGSDDRQEQLRQNMEQQEQQRRALLAQPAFEPGANPLLGRWQRERAAQQQDVFAQAVALASDITCTSLSGGGQFEFRDGTLAREDGTVEPMQYRQGGRGVVYAMGEEPLRLLEFQFDGRDRITWATCAFNRMGAAAVSVPSPTTRTPQQVVTGAQTSMEAAKPGPPRLPPPGSDGQFILDTCDAEDAGAKNCFDLGHAYANGFGVEQNMPLSMELFRKACKLGHQTACKRAYGE